ncbi:MAG: PPOX class F420-dependent oxidoreductase [Anaerolineaceae bacterium]
MTAPIPASHRDLLEKPNFAHVATLMKDGSPQVTPVWIDINGEKILFNTAEGRQKDRNLKRDARVALSVHDNANPYRYIQIRGRVAGHTTDGADTHIDKMAKKYLSLDSYPYRNAAEQRVTYTIQAEHVQVSG